MQDGNTSAMLAARFGHANVMIELIAGGADLTVLNNVSIICGDCKEIPVYFSFVVVIFEFCLGWHDCNDVGCRHWSKRCDGIASSGTRR